uniref:Cytochrome P450 4C1 n=2 Tax=Cacopsylla melanoneura TaxID=428564 RepID=A0A8D8U0I8_9HEMI
MELIHILLTIILVFLGTKLIYWFSKRIKFIRRIEKMPGPQTWPLIGTSWYFLRHRQNLFKCIRALVQKYGPVYRTWTGGLAIVHLTRPEHVELVLNNSRNNKKSFGYTFLHDWLGLGLLTSSGEKWFSHRKMITPTFHFEILETFFNTFSRKSDILIDNLSQHSKQGDEFDITPYISKCALDIICETAMGIEVHAQGKSDSEYVRSVYEIAHLVVQRGIRPWLWPNFLFGLTEFGKRHQTCLNVLHGFSRRVIEERKRERVGREKGEADADEDQWGKKRRVAFLDLLIDESEKSETPLTNEEIREEVDTFMFEGFDTTAMAISWSLFLLGSHPEYQDNVYAELESIFGDDYDRPITSRDCAQMKYLERVIKEALRLFPSVPSIGRMMEEDMQVGEYLIPTGAVVILHILDVHRCEDQFPQPAVFQPDNFLSENMQKRHVYSYIPFSAGPRNCIGQKFALLEEKCVLASVLRKFKVISQEKLEDLLLLNELTLKSASGVRVKLEPRT